MISIEELRQIRLLDDLNEDLLGRVAHTVRVQSCAEREVIYEQGAVAGDFLYAVKRGKILLEVKLGSSVAISVESVKPGQLFGWPSMLGQISNGCTAICPEESEIFVFDSKAFSALMHQDQSIGYLVFKKMAFIINRRLFRRTEQFLTMMSQHPVLKGLVP